MAMHLAAFDEEDLEIGALLGTGGFCSVYCVRKRHLGGQKALVMCERNTTVLAVLLQGFAALAAGDAHHHDNTSTHNHNNFRDGFVEIEEAQALKRLHRRTLKDPEKTRVAFQHLQKEVQLLSQLPSHPHIVRLCGISEDFWSSASRPETAFFLQERLSEPLDRALQLWRTAACIAGGRNSSSNKAGGVSKKYLSLSSQAQRLQKAAVGTARALEFLHAHKIMYRDLKPGNVGFDAQGQVRLFDFGLSRQMPAENKTFLLTRRVGTLRYMAPEMASCDEYTYAADVYSLGMVVWEVCALEKPYDGVATNYETLNTLVTLRENHPPTNVVVASKTLRKLLNHCWHVDPSQRPTMESIVKSLQAEVQKGADKKKTTNSKGRAATSKKTAATCRPLLPSIMGNSSRVAPAI